MTDSQAIFRPMPPIPPLAAGSPTARALYGLMAGEPIVPLEPEPGRTPLETMEMVIAQLARYRDNSRRKILLPTGTQQPWTVGSALIEVFEAAGAKPGRAAGAHLMIDFPMADGGFRMLTIMLLYDHAIRRDQVSTGLLLACTQFAPQMVQRPVGLTAAQTLLVGAPEDPMRPASDELRAATSGPRDYAWGPIPTELILAASE